jgi:hypothetical protein
LEKPQNPSSEVIMPHGYSYPDQESIGHPISIEDIGHHNTRIMRRGRGRSRQMASDETNEEHECYMNAPPAFENHRSEISSTSLVTDSYTPTRTPFERTRFVHLPDYIVDTSETVLPTDEPSELSHETSLGPDDKIRHLALFQARYAEADMSSVPEDSRPVARSIARGRGGQNVGNSTYHTNLASNEDIEAPSGPKYLSQYSNNQYYEKTSKDSNHNEIKNDVEAWTNQIDWGALERNQEYCLQIMEEKEIFFSDTQIPMHPKIATQQIQGGNPVRSSAPAYNIGMFQVSQPAPDLGSGHVHSQASRDIPNINNSNSTITESQFDDDDPFPTGMIVEARVVNDDESTFWYGKFQGLRNQKMCIGFACLVCILLLVGTIVVGMVVLDQYGPGSDNSSFSLASADEPTVTPVSSYNPEPVPTDAPITATPSQPPSGAFTSNSPKESPSDSQDTDRPTTAPFILKITTLPTETPSIAPTTSLPTDMPSIAPTTALPTEMPSIAPTTIRPTVTATTIPPTNDNRKMTIKSILLSTGNEWTQQKTEWILPSITVHGVEFRPKTCYLSRRCTEYTEVFKNSLQGFPDLYNWIYPCTGSTGPCTGNLGVALGDLELRIRVKEQDGFDDLDPIEYPYVDYWWKVNASEWFYPQQNWETRAQDSYGNVTNYRWTFTVAEV